jgi:hypothetical protein
MPKTDTTTPFEEYRDSLIRNIEESGFLILKTLIYGALLLLLLSAAYQNGQGVTYAGAAFFAALAAVFFQYVAAQCLYTYETGGGSILESIGWWSFVLVFLCSAISAALLLVVFLRISGALA